MEKWMTAVLNCGFSMDEYNTEKFWLENNIEGPWELYVEARNGDIRSIIRVKNACDLALIMLKYDVINVR